MVCQGKNEEKREEGEGGVEGELPPCPLVMPEIPLELHATAFDELISALQDMELSKMTIGTFGVHLKQLICRSPTSLGKLSNIILRSCTRSFFEADFDFSLPINQDLLPLPYAAWSAEDMRSLIKQQAAGSFNGTESMWVSEVNQLSD